MSTIDQQKYAMKEIYVLKDGDGRYWVRATIEHAADLMAVLFGKKCDDTVTVMRAMAPEKFMNAIRHFYDEQAEDWEFKEICATVRLAGGDSLPMNAITQDWV